MMQIFYEINPRLSKLVCVATLIGASPLCGQLPQALSKLTRFIT
jgi:hypothetical protein